MKVVHWALKNGSGLHRMAEEIAAAEKSSGLDASCLDGDDPREIPLGSGAEIHVIHGHIPDILDAPEAKKVFLAHGTPETCFTAAVNDSCQGHGASDPWMTSLHRIRTADAVATFWPRHQAIWQSMVGRGRAVDLLPMGLDRAFWTRPPSLGKWAGAPSLFTAENCHPIKWPLDLLLAMPWVMEKIRTLRLHCFCLPWDQNRWWSTLAYANGSAYRSFMQNNSLAPEALRNAFASVDYYIGLVRYGDFNRICLEARAAGCPVISYRGNEYADYWIDEGDQRTIAAQLLMILAGQVPRRETPDVPDISETVAVLGRIYERVLA